MYGSCGVDDVLFSHNGQALAMQIWHILKVTHQGAVPGQSRLMFTMVLLNSIAGNHAEILPEALLMQRNRALRFQ